MEREKTKIKQFRPENASLCWSLLAYDIQLLLKLLKDPGNEECTPKENQNNLRQPAGLTLIWPALVPGFSGSYLLSFPQSSKAISRCGQLQTETSEAGRLGLTGEAFRPINRGRERHPHNEGDDEKDGTAHLSF